MVEMTEQEESSSRGQSSFYDHHDDSYVLSRDHLGVVRHALQHYIWEDALGYNIHPSVKLPKAPRIADVACGTGLWMFGIAQKNPTAWLDGFDISLEQSPPDAWLPKNVRVHDWSFVTDPPEEFIGAFDLVHVRLVGLQVKGDEPDILVNNLWKLMKPGAYLQWFELDTWKTYIAKAHEDLETPAMDEWCTWMREPKDVVVVEGKEGDYNWKANLPKKLNSTGFENAKVESVLNKMEARMDLAKYNSDQLIMLTDLFIENVYSHRKSKANYMREMMDQVKEESKKGAAMMLCPIVYTARKKQSKQT